MSKAIYGITVRAVGDHVMEATGGTDGRVIMGPKGTPNSFSPVELLLAAIAGCSGIDLQTVSKNADADPGEFELRVRGSKALGGDGLTEITVEYEVPGIDPGQLEPLIAQAKQLCTVSLTVEESCQIDSVIASD